MMRSCYKSVKRVILPCSMTFWRILITLIFAIFPAIRKNKFPQIIITANIFPARIYTRVNILQLKVATQKYSTKKSCLFNHNLSLSFKQNGIQRNTGLLFENMYFCFTHSINTKILSMLGTGYFLKIAKINSQREKSNLSQSQKLVPAANPQK